jgi:hypothetical protein
MTSRGDVLTSHLLGASGSLLLCSAGGGFSVAADMSVAMMLAMIVANSRTGKSTITLAFYVESHHQGFSGILDRRD